MADGRNWPAQVDWEFGPDAFRGPWLYEENRVYETDELVAEDDPQPSANVRGR